MTKKQISACRICASFIVNSFVNLLIAGAGFCAGLCYFVYNPPVAVNEPSNTKQKSVEFINEYSEDIDHCEEFNGRIVFYMKDGSMYGIVGSDYMRCGTWDRSDREFNTKPHFSGTISA